jgi:chemotaxis protein methyltransferase CheR
VYAAERTRALPPGWLPQYFLRGEGTSKGFYQIKPELRAKVEFRRLNLMQPLPWGELFPLVFCRNVMIYFNKATQADLVNRMAACIEPGGYLFVGHAESLTGIDHPLQYVRPAVYRKPA